MENTKSAEKRADLKIVLQRWKKKQQRQNELRFNLIVIQLFLTTNNQWG